MTPEGYYCVFGLFIVERWAFGLVIVIIVFIMVSCGVAYVESVLF